MRLKSLEVAEKLEKEFEEEIRKEVGDDLSGDESLRENIDSFSSQIQTKFLAKSKITSVKHRLEDAEQRIKTIDTRNLEDLIGKYKDNDDGVSTAEELDYSLEKVLDLLEGDIEEISFPANSSKELEDSLNRRKITSELVQVAKMIADAKSSIGRQDFFQKGEKGKEHGELIRTIEEDRIDLLNKIPEIDAGLRNIEKCLQDLEDQP